MTITTDQIVQTQKFGFRRKKWHGRVDTSKGRIVHQTSFNANDNTMNIQVYLIDQHNRTRTRTWEGSTGAGSRVERVVLLARELLDTSIERVAKQRES